MADKRSSKGTTSRRRRQPAHPVVTVDNPNTPEEWALVLAVLYVEHQRGRPVTSTPLKFVASDRQHYEATD